MKHNYRFYQVYSLVVPIFFLILAIPNWWPYGFFQILRWVVFLGAIYHLFYVSEKQSSIKLLIYLFVAIIYNPIMPIHAEKFTHQIINVLVAIFLSVEYFRLVKNKES